jgi:hypothetical protein
VIYCELILKDIGIDCLKALLQTAINRKYEPLISLCKKTLDIFKREYYYTISLPTPQRVDLRRNSI